MRTWNFPDVHPSGPGPWADEPDKAQWVDEATDFDCLIVRSKFLGSLCGYVGVPPEHPWHGWPSHAVHKRVLTEREVSFAGLCHEQEDGGGICHVPEPGRSEAVWWLGFATNHYDDVNPNVDARDLRDFGSLIPDDPDCPRVYRTFDWTRDQVTALALQLYALARISQPAAQL